MKIIAGLGNPGKRYESTRHNLGFRAIDRLADELGISIIKSKHKALVGEKTIGGEKIMLIKPMTFMNLSGQSIREAINYYGCPVEELIVVYDDCSLPPGSVRVRESGSDGGHNGMKNIISELGTMSFTRVRIGIGEKPAQWDLADYVLSGFSNEEKPEIEKAINDAADCVLLILKGNINEAMNSYNRKKAAPENENRQGKKADISSIDCKSAEIVLNEIGDKNVGI